MFKKELISEHGLAVAIITLVASVGSSFVTSYFTSQSAKDQAVTDAQPAVLKLFQEHNSGLIKRVSDLESELRHIQEMLAARDKRIAELELIVAQQFDEIKTLEAYPENMPGPAWMKDKNSRMLLINEAYRRQWGVSKWQYIGKTDYDVWPEEIADSFVENDKEVIKCRCAIRTVERIPEKANEPISPSNPVVEWIVWKWPVVKNGEIFGLAGATFKK